MSRSFKTVDLLAGPGGLAEGFSSLRNTGGKRIFDIALSVEKEPSAFATLRLRAFTRQFTELPDCYYQYLAGDITREALAARYPEEWKAAEDETAMLVLGTEQAQKTIDPHLDRIRGEAGGNTIVIGGPPCQAYSLVGRARIRDRYRKRKIGLRIRTNDTSPQICMPALFIRRQTVRSRGSHVTNRVSTSLQQSKVTN